MKTTYIHDDDNPTGRPVVVSEIAVGEYIGLAHIRTSWWDIFLPKTPESFTYDADGNLTLDGVWHYEWDAENRLAAMQMRDEVAQVLLTGSNPWVRIEFAYDWMGRRIMKLYQTTTNDPATHGGKHAPPILWAIDKDVRYVYDGWHLSMSYRADGLLSGESPDQSFAWGPDISGTYGGAGGIGGLVAYTDDQHDALNPAPSDPDFLGPMFPIYDGNGNIVKMIRFESLGGSPEGFEAREAASYEYGPFGENRSTTGELGAPGAGGTHQGQRNPFRFSTKYTDAETGLVCYGYRYYSPSLGRWISRDPIEEGDGPNLLAFAQNSPINFVDPYGLWKWLGGKRQGNSRAMMLPEAGDDVLSAAMFVGLDPQQSSRWLFDETRYQWVGPSESIDECNTYSVPNLYYVTTGNMTNPMGWKNMWGWHTGLNSIWWLTSLAEQTMSRTDDFAAKRREQGFRVIRLTNITKRELEQIVKKKDIAALYFGGHGANGVLWTGEVQGRNKVGLVPSDLTPRMHHSLSEVVLFVCEADQYQLRMNRHTVVSWSDIVSPYGVLRASIKKVRPLFTEPDELPEQPGGPR